MLLVLTINSTGERQNISHENGTRNSRAENVYTHEYFICFLLTLRMYDFVPVRVLFMIRIILIPIRLYTLQHLCGHVAQSGRHDGKQRMLEILRFHIIILYGLCSAQGSSNAFGAWTLHL